MQMKNLVDRLKEIETRFASIKAAHENPDPLSLALMDIVEDDLRLLAAELDAAYEEVKM